MKCPAIERVLITFMLCNVLLFDFTSAQTYAQCVGSMGECIVKGFTGTCGEVLQCLTNLNSTCNIIGFAEVLSRRITFVEYKCSDQGQADYEEYTSCLSKQGGLYACLAAFGDYVKSSCMPVETYQNCLKSNCGERTARYVNNELGTAPSCWPKSGSNVSGGVDLLQPKCSIMWFSILVYMMNALY